MIVKAIKEKAVNILLIIVFGVLCANGQKKDTVSFRQLKKTVDSLTERQTAFQSYTSGFLKGEIEEAAFEGEYSYSKSSTDSILVAKIGCRFENDSLGQKYFYYNQNELVKINDKGKVYYCSKALYASDGTKVTKKKENYLRHLEQQLRSIIISLLR